MTRIWSVFFNVEAEFECGGVIVDETAGILGYKPKKVSQRRNVPFDMMTHVNSHFKVKSATAVGYWSFY
jgi:hypothetical protein